MPLSCPACRQATAIGQGQPVALSAEQLVDLAAEAVTIVVQATGGDRLADTHMDSPSYRLARAAGVTPKCLRAAGSRTVKPAALTPVETTAVPADPLEAAAKNKAEADTERKDDLLELAHIHTRLNRVDGTLRRQQRQISALTATYVKRFVHPNGRFPSYCCQRCGEQIGWIGRAFQAIGVLRHACHVEREEA